LSAIASAAINSISDSALQPQNLSNLAWAFAKLAFSHAPLLAAISAAAIRRLEEFRSQELANTAWSIATLSFAD